MLNLVYNVLLTVVTLFLAVSPGKSKHHSVLDSGTQDTIILSRSANVALGHSYLFFLKDQSGTDKTEEIISHGNFIPAEKEILNFGYTASTIWIRLIVTNDVPDRMWSLVVENPNLETISVYDDHARLLYWDSKNTKKYINYLFPVDTGTHVIFLKIKSNEPFFLPIKVADVASLIEFQNKMDLWQGLFLGIMLCVILYNLVIYFAIRDIAYVHYVLYSVFIALTFGHISGYFVQWISPRFFWLNEFSIFNSMAATFVVLFVFSFLRDIIRKWMKIVGIVLLVFLATSLIVAFIGQHLYANAIMQLSCFFIGILLLILGFYALLKLKHKPARFFLIAWSIFLVTAIIYLLKDFGIIPYNVYTQYGIQIGCAIEAILMSLALADKITQIRLEGEQMQRREYEYQLQFSNFSTVKNALLQQAVHDNTIELQRANKIKDKFFTIIAHDLRTPLIALVNFLSIFQSKVSGPFSREDLKMISKGLSVSVRNTIDLTENLLVWAKSQMHLDRVVPENIGVKVIVSQCLKELKDVAETNGITIHDSTPYVEVIADENQLKFIMRNLISNALKFTSDGGRVTISARTAGGKVSILVADTGIGMSESVLDTLFNIDVKKSLSGTRGEKGSGLGLILCKEFVERNNGSMQVQSIEGEGTTFTVTLPAPPEIPLL